MPRTKPKKPKDSPLTPMSNGQWGKKIRGKIHYFGVWADYDTALGKYLDERDDLQAGRTPKRHGDARLTIHGLCDDFLKAKAARRDTGELSVRMFLGYYRICESLIKHFGRTAVVEELTPADLERFRGVLSKGASLVTLGNRVQHARVVFRYASETDLIKHPIKFGPGFKKPAKRLVRAERQAKPAKMFEAGELRTIIDAARVPLKAMILLGINCGFGQTDCSSLPIKSVDLINGWVDFPRPKTGVERRCHLWPETINAIREVIKSRRQPSNESISARLFINKLGLEYVRVTSKGENQEKGINLDGITLEFNKLLAKLELSAPGKTFYALRHTFETIGGGCRDQVAVNSIMGHAPASNDMSAVYREHVEDERLKLVTDHVHTWLWPPKKTRATKKAK